MPLWFVKKGTAPAPPAPPPEERPDWRTMRGQAVGDSEDLRRILALPTRSRPPDGELAVVGADLKKRFGLDRKGVPCDCQKRWGRKCCDTLLPTQAWALHEAETVGGVLGPIGVGHGKTLLDILVSLVVGAKTAVLLLPPNLKRQFLEVDWHYYSQHWQVPNLAGGKFYTPGRPFLYVVAFSELSGAKATELLGKNGLKPDVLIVDEAHSVRNRGTARTKRFLRFFKEFPETKLFCWSGTLTARSIRDYAHLAQFSLRSGSPVPSHYAALEEWAAALDPSDFQAPEGRLVSLPGSGDVRERFRRRLVQTPGVVSSGDAASCQASLIISERKVEAPEVVNKHLKNLEATWQRPDGEELVDALSKVRCAKELSCGFYYRWRYPRGEPVAVIERWLEVRKEWHKELREKLKKGGPHMDSPLLCTKAAIRWQKGYTHVFREAQNIKNTRFGDTQDNGDEPEFVVEYRETGRLQIPPRSRGGPLPVWDSNFWPEWEAVRETVRPETEAVWVSDFLVEDCLAWLAEGPGLLWYEFDGLAQRVCASARQRKLVYCYCGPGDEGNARVIGLTGRESVIASTRAHGTGKNLQQFSRNLIANPSASGSEYEQLLGRTHRQGQTADEVTVELYRHTEVLRNAIERARGLSEYIEDTFGASQRLNTIATWTFDT